MFRPFFRPYCGKEVKYDPKLFQGTNVKSEERIFERLYGSVWTGFIWLTLGASGYLL
jgi:hypothetical protein